MKWKTTISAALIGLMFLLGACSNNDAANEGTSPTSGASQEASQSAEASPSESASAEAVFPRTVAGANGDVTIGSKPQRVALVHWGLGDDLITFDLPSIALALPFTDKQSAIHSDVYKPYVDKFGELKIIGENTAVNMEALLAYAPDLIIAGTDTNKEILGQLPKIATTYVIDEKTTDVWSDWQGVMTKFGELLGQEDVAAKFIADYDAKVTAAKEKLANVEGNVAFIQVRDNAVWLQGTNYTGQYYDSLGLSPPPEAKGEGAELSLEGLGAINPDHLFLGYFNYSDKTIPALTDEWEKSEVWKMLKSVENGHTYPINGELALGFGPIGKAYGVDEIVKALESK